MNIIYIIYYIVYMYNAYLFGTDYDLNEMCDEFIYSMLTFLIVHTMV